MRRHRPARGQSPELLSPALPSPLLDPLPSDESGAGSPGTCPRVTVTVFSEPSLHIIQSTAVWS